MREQRAQFRALIPVEPNQEPVVNRGQRFDHRGKLCTSTAGENDQTTPAVGRVRSPGDETTLFEILEHRDDLAGIQAERRAELSLMHRAVSKRGENHHVTGPPAHPQQNLTDPAPDVQ